MEYNKMTPAKDWKIVRSNPLSNGTGYCIDLEIESTSVHLDFWVHGKAAQSEAKAKLYINSIVTAVDSTFGAGINPEAIPLLFNALTNLCTTIRESRLFDDYLMPSQDRDFFAEANAALLATKIK